MNISLEGRTILVTGGTGALGSALVGKLLDEKARVFFTYCKNRASAAALETRGAKGFSLDLEDRGAIRQLKERLKEHTAALDGLVNNAAIVADRTISKLSVEDWDRVLEADLTSVFLLTRSLLPLLYRSKRAKIINLTSRVGVKGAFGQGNYAAAKAGLIGFTKSLAREVGRKGICVNAVNPGFMITGMNRDLPGEILAERKRESMLGIFSDPERAADFILFLLSDRADTITGQVFHLDSRPL